MPKTHDLHGINVVPLGSAGQINVRYHPLPDECPVCHAHGEPKVLAPAFFGPYPGGRFELAFQCTRQACGRVFVGTYEHTNVDSPIGEGHYRLQTTAPMTFLAATFPECVESTSPTFVKVYNQALAAEVHSLDQLTGIGLRKALEFLVKDFAIARNAAQADAIKKSPLAQCINKYIEDANVKKCAPRAAWLGNDETHYIRKWTDRDIGDLKLLLKLTVNWVENVLLTEVYEREMPDANEIAPSA